jgi:hypothetical protein
MTKNLEKHSLYSMGKSFLPKIDAKKIIFDEKIQFKSSFSWKNPKTMTLYPSNDFLVTLILFNYSFNLMSENRTVK